MQTMQPGQFYLDYLDSADSEGSAVTPERGHGCIMFAANSTESPDIVGGTVFWVSSFWDSDYKAPILEISGTAVAVKQ